MSGHSLRKAHECLTAVSTEAWRIERKFTRFRDDSVLADINRSQGKPVRVDAETARLLDCAAELYAISDGLFDVTSGCLREAWHFDGGSKVPSQQQIDQLLPRIGWHLLDWQAPEISLPPGVEIDFGGIGKEYATDRCLDLAEQLGGGTVLVNLGGDVAANGPRQDGQPWRVAIEGLGHDQAEPQPILLERGGIATSGDERRFVEKDGVRYSHVLDPRTGWPVVDAPNSVTVIGSNCSEAGMCSTLALLNGAKAEHFLKGNQVAYWVQYRDVQSRFPYSELPNTRQQTQQEPQAFFQSSRYEDKPNEKPRYA